MKRITLSVQETAKLIGLSRNGVYTAVKEGTIPSIRVGRRVLIPRAELEHLIGEIPDDALKPDGEESG